MSGLVSFFTFPFLLYSITKTCLLLCYVVLQRAQICTSLLVVTRCKTTDMACSLTPWNSLQHKNINLGQKHLFCKRQNKTKKPSWHDETHSITMVTSTFIMDTTHNTWTSHNTWTQHTTHNTWTLYTTHEHRTQHMDTT